MTIEIKSNIHSLGFAIIQESSYDTLKHTRRSINMNNFTFYNPVKILFGKGQIANLRGEIPENAKILMTYGGGSIKKNGVYDQVMAALKGFELIEFQGIEPNPTYQTLMKAVAIAKQHHVNFILAVGGGSVIDGTKFIAAAFYHQGNNPWQDILVDQQPITKALPYGAVLTLPATGSEMNTGAVVSNTQTHQKLFFLSESVYPKFSVLDPETTYTLSERQMGNGIVDAFTHVIEQYLTYPVDAPLQDRFAEGILQTLIEEGPKIFTDPKAYHARASIMWCATMALNNLIRCGVPEDWATHMIGHEITALHGLDHAQTLAIILPAVMQVQSEQKKEKLLQYAERVWHIQDGSAEERIAAAISKTKSFFESVGVKTKFSDYELDLNLNQDIPKRLRDQGRLNLGEHADIDEAKVVEILNLAA